MAYLAHQPWKETEAYFAENDAVLIAIGAIHGHDHIPQGIDLLAPEHLVKRIEERTGVLVAPSIAYGPMRNYMGYSGCISPSAEVFQRYTQAIVDDLIHWGARRFYFMNGHSGNTFPLQEIAFEVRQKGGVGVIFEWWRLLGALDPELNAAVNRVPDSAPEGVRSRTRGIETAVAAAIIPGYHEGTVSARIISSRELFPDSPFETNFATGLWFKNVLVPVRFGSRETTLIGEVGTGATAEMGRQIMDSLVDYMSAFITELNQVEIPPFGG
jgi:creatinine amidohydrolase